MQRVLLACLICSLQFTNALAQLPDSDIWIFDLQSEKDSIVLSNPMNITDRKGYDNQPSFSPNGKYILYSSMRDDKQTDIFRYTLATKKTDQFTNTATSEYSPNIMPDGKNISVVMVEPDSTQRLWKFPLAGGKPSLVMKDIDSIGYYCWISKDSLALVMITEPPVLNVIDLKTKKQKVIARDVSRCMQKFKQNNKAGFLFMYRTRKLNEPWKLTYSNYDRDYHVAVDVDGKIMNENDPKKLIEPLVPNNSEDYAVFTTSSKQSFILYGSNTSIHIIKWESKEAERIIDLASFGISNINRIAISPDGRKIAIVTKTNQ